MIERIIVLLKRFYSKMSDSLYMLRCSDRSYFALYTVILVTLRDCNHITWFCNSASVSLLATLSHRTWIANDFSSSQLSQKRSKLSDCTFWKFSYKRKFFFLTHFLYAKSTLNSDRRLYKEKWCDLMRTWSFLALTEIESRLHFLKFVVQTKRFLSDSFCVRENDTQRWSRII
jgi:hypothetical protein